MGRGSKALADKEDVNNEEAELRGSVLKSIVADV